MCVLISGLYVSPPTVDVTVKSVQTLAQDIRNSSSPVSIGATNDDEHPIISTVSIGATNDDEHPIISCDGKCSTLEHFTSLPRNRQKSISYVHLNEYCNR